MNTHRVFFLIIFLGTISTVAGCIRERFGSPSPCNMTVTCQAQIQAAPVVGHVYKTALPPVSNNNLTSNQVAGVWKASVGGMTCQVATPQTKFGYGYRAGPLHCPIAFSRASSWAVENAHLIFYDIEGNYVALLSSSGTAQLAGKTVTGIPIVLSR